MARAMSMPTGIGKIGYSAALIGMTTLLGGVALQLGEIVSGRDPQDTANPQFWSRALLKGGGLGIFGDLMFQDYTKYGSSVGALAAGPLEGTLKT